MNESETALTTMRGLLEGLYTLSVLSRKTDANVHVDYVPGKPERTITIREDFGGGKGRSDAFTGKTRSVAPEVFDEAVKKSFLTGAVRPGRISKEEFVVTHAGLEEYLRMLVEERIAGERRQSA